MRFNMTKRAIKKLDNSKFCLDLLNGKLGESITEISISDIADKEIHSRKAFAKPFSGAQMSDLYKEALAFMNEKKSSKGIIAALGCATIPDCLDGFEVFADGLPDVDIAIGVNLLDTDVKHVLCVTYI